ncbi:hypothetical protein VCHA43P273_70215 [Vibrio chagasii]|nr:hypothetical protein VCHA54P499_20467 [Vibrio chagasii]CAH7248825.1 hypothetical protein VCHA53O466_20470 [Vibrio chagasii]CAH7414871.1 hypothetical protein VCHA43P273_70215 [Vibrio chagasii]
MTMWVMKILIAKTIKKQKYNDKKDIKWLFKKVSSLWLCLAALRLMHL